jgi:hypothetical protein
MCLPPGLGLTKYRAGLRPKELVALEDTREQPWKAYIAVSHMPDAPQVLSTTVRLLGQRVNAHQG